MTTSVPFQRSRYIRDFVPGEGAAHLALRKGDDLVERGVIADIGAQIGKSRDAIFRTAPCPAGRTRDLRKDGEIDIESAGDPRRHFARPRGAHRHVERQDQHAATGSFGAADQVEADGVDPLPANR